MNKGDVEAFRYRLMHCRNRKQIQKVLRAYPEFKGKPLEDIRSILDIYNDIQKGYSLGSSKKRRKLWARRAYAKK